MNIYRVIEEESKGHRSKTAVRDGDRLISYEELFDRVRQVAALLGGEGVARLHRVGLLCDDSIDYVVISLAILSLEAAVVPVSPDLAMAERQEVIARIDVDFFLADGALQAESAARPVLPGLSASRNFILLQRRAAPPPEGYGEVNPAFIRFSSGTTGASKGVVLSHEAIIARTAAADKGLQITADDTVLWVLSMSYHFVVTILLFLRRGATIVLCGGNFPHNLIDEIKQHQATFIYASPFHYSLLAGSGDVGAADLQGIRMAVSTAMKLPIQTAADFAGKFGLELTEAYGIIEVGLPFIRLVAGSTKTGSVGRPLPDYRIRLVNPDDDGIGEIQISGPGLLDAYYTPWQEKDAILVDGWFATGDLGRIDADGFLFIVGRSKDVINFVGMKIFPLEVEAVIDSFPGVAESQVYASPHERFGELPAARIVPREGVNGESLLPGLRRFCYQQLASYKVPKEFEIVTSLVKTASGKLKR
jgi:long-chain acyl-CoA synthetase